MRVFVALALITVASAVVGAAASVTLATGSLGAAKVTVPRCTTSAYYVTQNLAVNNVVSITLTAVPAACGGATALVTLNNMTTSSSGSGTVPAGGGSITVSIASAIAATTIEEIDIVLVGP